MTALQTRYGSRKKFPTPAGTKDVVKVLDDAWTPENADDEAESADPKQKTGAPGTLAALLAQAVDGNLYELKSWRADSEDADGRVAELLDKSARRGKFYRVGRAIASAEKRGLKGVDGLEGEVSQELKRITNRSIDGNGFFLPWNLPVQSERRNLTLSTGAGAIALQLPPGLLIDVVRAKLAIARLGGQMLRLTAPGQISLPVKTGTVTGQWIAEGGAATGSNMTIGAARYDAHTVSATTNVSRRLLTLAEPGFDQMIIDDLITTLTSMIDISAINGLGQNGEPLGLLQNPALQGVTLANDSGNGAAPLYTDIVAMETLLAKFNGDTPMDARIGFLTSPPGRSILRRTDLGGATKTGKFVWKCHPMLIDSEVRSVESVLGYPAVATNAVPSNLTEGSGTSLTTACLGNFADFLTALFGPLSIIVNPMTQSQSGNVGVSAFQDVDMGFRRWQSAVKLAGILTT
jgi:HK97 family phage major capsid protein